MVLWRNKQGGVVGSPGLVGKSKGQVTVLRGGLPGGFYARVRKSTVNMVGTSHRFDKCNDQVRALQADC
jgi:hypothetical protein